MCLRDGPAEIDRTLEEKKLNNYGTFQRLGARFRTLLELRTKDAANSVEPGKRLSCRWKWDSRVHSMLSCRGRQVPQPRQNLRRRCATSRVMGCLHLVGMNEQIIPEMVEAMRTFVLSVMEVGHCTGWRAVRALANAFGTGRVVPMSAGKRISF